MSNNEIKKSKASIKKENTKLKKLKKRLNKKIPLNVVIHAKNLHIYLTNLK